MKVKLLPIKTHENWLSDCVRNVLTLAVDLMFNCWLDVFFNYWLLEFINFGLLSVSSQKVAKVYCLIKRKISIEFTIPYWINDPLNILCHKKNVIKA